MAASMASFSIVVDECLLDKAVKELENVKDGVIHEIEAMSDVALICIVGEGLRETKGIASRTFRAVAEEGVNVVKH